MTILVIALNVGLLLVGLTAILWFGRLALDLAGFAIESVWHPERYNKAKPRAHRRWAVAATILVVWGWAKIALLVWVFA